MIGGVGGDSSGAGAGDETDLEEVGFDDVFEGVAFFAEGGRECFDAGGTSVIGGDEGFEEVAVELVES